MLEIIFLIFLGVLVGVFTGLTPGIHPNTVIFALMPFYFAFDIGFSFYASFISGVSLSHTFHDFIPSIFLGVPEPESALAALPGQKLALEGRGLQAFDYTVYGGVYSMVTALVLSYPVYMVMESVYSFFQPFMEYCLLFILLFIIFKSNKWRNSLTVSVLSGLLGVLSFSSPVNQQYVLTPIFAGLFAFPSVFNALNEGAEIPDQTDMSLSRKVYWSGGVTGFLASLPITVFPGLSNSISTTFLMPLVEKKKESFLSATGSVNTSDIFLSFLALMAMERARSGASVALQTTGNSGMVIFVLGASILAASFSAPLSLFTARRFLDSWLMDNQRFLSYGVMLVLVLSVLYLTGGFGFLIFLTACFIGFIASMTDERHAAMTVLLFPALRFFAGSGIFM
ncbi:MAG: putative membrane protein [Candidatus Nanohaloarchaea archaeon]|jgi:putative membrane protein